MEAFHSGTATTLVATDIAARGIHVDDVALVIHADPPTEHKAYLHRSGRTARAGAEGTVITLMTDEQQRDVRDLTRLAGIKPTTTKVSGPGHAMLEQLAPGVRSTPGGLVVEAPASTGGGGRSNGANAQRKRARSTGQTNGQSRRGNPTVVHQRDPRRPARHRWRPASSLRRRPGRQVAARVAARARAVAATVVVAPVAAASPPAPRPAVARTARRRSAAVADPRPQSRPRPCVSWRLRGESSPCSCRAPAIGVSDVSP